ncbi:MAG TPA: methyltransferase [Gemmatimonadales bacterium]|nr:methyltransferase [Gemmatimonadales bacterium]
MTALATVALAYYVASRLTYVLFIGVALRRQERDEVYTRRHGVEGGFRRFRRIASLVMANDVLAFALLCLLTRETLALGVSGAVLIAVGGALILVGIAVKVWAARTLGARAYYWYNFFATGPRESSVRLAGPYRFLANPMYTIGYLQAYGFALITESLPGLVAAAFAQAAILAFYYAVERPHFRRLVRQTAAPPRP